MIKRKDPDSPFWQFVDKVIDEYRARNPDWESKEPREIGQPYIPLPNELHIEALDKYCPPELLKKR